MNSTIRWLRQYNSLQAEIKDIDLQMEELRQQDGMTGIDTTQEPTGKTYKINSITENTAISIADKLILLEQRQKHLQRLLDRINNALGALTEVEREIIQHSVMQREWYYQFTHIIHTSERSCKRIKKEAIKKIEDILFNHAEP